jgi:ferrous iron transport protein A
MVFNTEDLSSPPEAQWCRSLTFAQGPFHTSVDLKLSVKNGSAVEGPGSENTPLTLDRLENGEEALLDRIDLPEDDARRLMELGFLPGALIVAAGRSPFGDPRVFRVDGSEVALRRETAVHLYIRPRKNVSESG